MARSGHNRATHQRLTAQNRQLLEYGRLQRLLAAQGKTAQQMMDEIREGERKAQSEEQPF